MEILVKINDKNQVTTMCFFDEKINSKEYIYIDLTQDEINKYSDMIPYLYYIDNKFIYKDDNKFRINELTTNLSKARLNLESTDYKIIKCYEAFMRQLPLPYNLEELSAQRDAWRAEINQLEEELKELE
jgi:hypothetical protein